MISFDDVSHEFGAFSLKNISFTIEKGEYFVIIGPTGAGKTLILETIAGFYTPREGQVRLNGLESTLIPPEGRNVGFVYQDYALFPHMTVEENIAFGLSMRKVGPDETSRRIHDIMELLSISHLTDRYPASLSGGEQQRVALARALVVEPDILLLDEPLSALDSRTREALRGELRRIHEIKGTTTVHVTHDQNEALMLADRVAMIIDGELVQVDTPQRLFNMPSSVKIANFVGVENILEGVVTSNKDGVALVEIDGHRIRVVSDITGEVYAFIRPEDVILSLQRFDSSARNVLECTVEEVNQFGPTFRVRLDTGIIALVTKQSVEDLGLAPGVKVYASFKATAAHLIRR